VTEDETVVIDVLATTATSTAGDETLPGLDHGDGQRRRTPRIVDGKIVYAADRTTSTDWRRQSATGDADLHDARHRRATSTPR
jgi:hypothetical protein